MSDDRQGRSTSVTDQRAACEKVIRDNGWELAGEFCDSDISASRFALKDRPAWKRLLGVVASGSLDVIVVWEPSRASRELEAWARFLNLCRERAVKIYVVTHHRLYDVAVARDWRSLAEDGVDSAYESEKTSERVRRGAQSALAAGKPFGAAALGYRRIFDPATGKPCGQEPGEHAQDIRDMFEALARGVAVSHVARDLGCARQVVQRRARNAGYAGLRKLGDGSMVRCEWEPLISEDLFWRVQAVLDQHTGHGVKPGKARWLLSCIARCGMCDGPVTVEMRGGKRPPKYVCQQSRHASLWVEQADLAVTAAVIAWIEKHLGEFSHSDDEAAQAARSDAARLGQRLDEAAASFAAGRIPISALEAIERQLRPELAAAQERARELSVPPALQQFASSAFPQNQAAIAVWNGMPLAARRDAIRAACVRITLNPVSSGEERLEVITRVK